MPQVTATFDVVTPLFLGGAEPASSVELRAASIKGALRFWWRALAWSRLRSDLAAIRAEESRLFGSAGEAESGERQRTGQASFSIRVRTANRPQLLRPGEILRCGNGTTVGPGARYLGYGLMQAFGSRKKGTKPGELTRPCIGIPLRFTAEFTSRTGLDSSIADALRLLGLLGGIGSRSRRGYGSLSLASLDGDVAAYKPPRSAAEYRGELQRIITAVQLDEREPPYSAFSKLSRIVIEGEHADALALLNDVGFEMQLYRSWGRNGKVGDRDSERNFTDDHDWFKERARARFAEAHPRRVIFGLPHNYSEDFGVISKLHDRRASPLFIHIHKLHGGKHVAALCLLRSQFLASGDKLWIWQGRPERPGGNPERIPPAQLRTPNPDWSVLHKFLDRFLQKPGSLQILP